MKPFPPPPSFALLNVVDRVWRMLESKERAKAGWLFVGIFINGFVDILGLAAVIPIVGLVVQPELIHENEYLSQAFAISNDLGIGTERGFLMLASMLLIAAFLLKAGVTLLLSLFQSRFALAVGHRISGIMWNFHFSQNLEAMRSTESGRILAEISGWPVNFSSVFLVGILRSLNELLVISVIAVILLIYDPLVFLIVGILISIGAVIIKQATRKRLASYSAIRRVMEPESATLINGAIRGFLEVASFGASKLIRGKYLNKTKMLYRMSSNTQVMTLVPAKLYEVLAVSALSIAIFLSLLLGKENEAFLNLLVMMALSAYRVMPSMTRINGNVMAMRNYYHVLNAMERGVQWVKDNEGKGDGEMEHLPIGASDIRLQEIECTYQDLDRPVIAGLSFAFSAGSIHAVVGESGSGKSTLIHALLGLHPLEKGSILIGSDERGWRSISDFGLDKWLRNIGFISQQPFIFSGSVLDNLTLGNALGAEERERVEKMLDRLNLRDCLGQEPFEFDLLEGGANLSGGQQQRLAILRAFCFTKPIVVLDEATSALDEGNRDVVFDLLRESADQGCIVILITHDRELASRCDVQLKLDVQSVAGQGHLEEPDLEG